MLTHRSVLEEAFSYGRIIADAMPVLVMMADPDGTVNYFNQAWFDFTGQAPFDRDVQRDWRRYIHPDDTERVARDWARAVEVHRDVIDMEYRLREGSTGLYRWVKARATAVRDHSGAIVQWIGTAMDIDDARRAHNALSEIAEAYQTASLPSLQERINGMRFASAYRASTSHLTACGDWYDAFPLSAGRTAICIGDVAGHGLHAATLMAKYRMSVRAIAVGGSDSILHSVEDAIHLESPEANATAFFGIISADKQSLHWSNAGHPPPLLVRSDGQMEWIACNEPPLGWRFGVDRTVNTTSLHGVGALVLYTDGLIESSRNMIEGMEQLRERVMTGLHREDLARHILEWWSPAPVQDDVAILTVSF